MYNSAIPGVQRAFRKRTWPMVGLRVVYCSKICSRKKTRTKGEAKPTAYGKKLDTPVARPDHSDSLDGADACSAGISRRAEPVVLRCPRSPDEAFEVAGKTNNEQNFATKRTKLLRGASVQIFARQRMFLGRKSRVKSEPQHHVVEPFLENKRIFGAAAKTTVSGDSHRSSLTSCISSFMRFPSHLDIRRPKPKEKYLR